MAGRCAKWLGWWLVLLICLALPSTAWSRDLHIVGFDAQITVAPDGTLKVRESLHAHFEGTWQGLYRTIPTEYTTQQQLNYTLFLDDFRVTDEGGTALPFAMARQGRYRELRIAVPGATDTDKIVVIEYRVLNALAFHGEYDELYWNVTGDEWDVPLERVTARIALPRGATQLRCGEFTGIYGSNRSTDPVSIDGEVVTVQTAKPLGLHEGLTVDLAWTRASCASPASCAVRSSSGLAIGPSFSPSPL
jgi:hypothetical protein